MTPAQFWDIEMQNQRANQRLAVEANLANQEQRRQMIGDIGQLVGMFAGQYAENKAMEAKGAAYGDFLKRHGEQLGFDPTYLEDFLKKKPREQAMIGDNIIGMQSAGKQLMNQEYLTQQMAGGGRTPGTGAGGGDQPFMRVP